MDVSAAAAVVLILIILTAETSESFSDGCHEHLSGSYKGACWPFINEEKCARTCVLEDFHNLSGACNTFQCWCYTPCNSKIAAGTPIRP
ncbi:hypothetical protein BS78_K260600 [Paspalum vaginatum]|uniref:Knottins-like domain-containing protein n=1 Tax=Paspalum vaginatum TaxID=158149 RepID=A0A9W8CGK5_9POAL|nr:hypothetical protein BS78_K260600 [Paspalum vaginatum]